MTLSTDIMNLRCSKQPQDGELDHAYCVGHRDARHAAAELASTLETKLANLITAGEMILDLNEDYHRGAILLRKAIEEARG